MKPNREVIDLPVPLSGELRERFSAYFREMSVFDPNLTPSNLAAQLLSDILEADLLSECPSRLN